MQDAVLDSAEAARPDLAGRADDRPRFGPPAKAGDPALVDLVTGDARIRQRCDIGDDVRQARADSLGAVPVIAEEQLVIGNGVEDEQRPSVI